MGLPVIQHPTFTLTLPSTKQIVQYRPFLVKEEKILLIAQASGEQTDILRAVKQVVANCILSLGINIDDFTTYDLEYFFIKLRSKSVQNVIKLTYRDNEDEQLYDVEVDLESVEVTYPEEVSNEISISDQVSLKIRHPRVNLINDAESISEGVDFNFFIIQSCIDKICAEGVEHDPRTYSKEELFEFVESLPVNAYQQIQEFIDAMPRIQHEIQYTNSKGRVVKIVLRTLTDFFTLG
jgi:hypothetical protein